MTMLEPGLQPLSSNDGEWRWLDPEASKDRLTPEAGTSGRVDDLKVGTLTFNDGSKYNGTLKHGVPHGLGTCVWADGNRYDGEWRNGLMHGFGTYLWVSGQRYDGEWKEGLRDGLGVKRYADGSTFDGFWRNGKKHGVGVYRPAQPEKRTFLSKSSSLRRPPLDTESIPLGDALNFDPTSTAPVRSIEAEGPRSDHAEDSVFAGPSQVPDKRTLFIQSYEEGRLVREDKLSHDEVKALFKDLWEPRDKRIRRRVKKALGIGKKLKQSAGQLLYKGMPGYDLMIRLQLGIRYSIGRMNQSMQSPQMIDLSQKLTPQDFANKAKIFFPSSGSTTTPAHPSSDFQWKDYSPKVFRYLRALWGVNDAEYMLCLGGAQSLRQLNSPGKSGCLFFLSDDERFLIKTMRKSEIEVLIGMLPLYYKHMEANPDSLITRFYGMHGIKQLHGRTVRFVVMSNIFNTEYQIHRKYDLKGSTEGRTAGNANPNDPSSVFKDLDLDIKMKFTKSIHDKLMQQIHSDVKFLQDIGVMDYSLLLGVHFVKRARPEEAADRPKSLSFHNDMGPSMCAHAPQLLSNHWTSSRRSVRSSHEGPTSATTVGGIYENGLSPHAAWRASFQSGHGTDGAEYDSGRLSPVLSPRNDGMSPSRNGLAHDEAGMEAGDAAGHDRARNFDVFSNTAELARQLLIVEQRMRELNYPEQRIQDVLGLAKLKMLGNRMKKASKTKPSAVIKAIQQSRLDLGMRMADMMVAPDAASDEELDSPRELLGAGGIGPTQLHLGYNIPAVAVPKHGGPPEDIVVCFGIIDILQDYNLRKLFERSFKSLMHDSKTISVAPPDKYAHRFIEFLEREAFMSSEDGVPRSKPSGQTLGGPKTLPFSGFMSDVIAEEA